MAHKQNIKQRYITFSNRTWEQIKLAYLKLQTRYRKVIMPLMSSLRCKAGMYTGAFIVTR